MAEVVHHTYENYFKNDFMDKEKRNKLFGKFIFIPMDFIEFKPERFWHIISFKPGEEKYTVNPCVNIYDSVLCKFLKSRCNEQVDMPTEKRLRGRCECLYRITRIHWINPILGLANKNDGNVKVWHEHVKDGSTNKMVMMKYVRFEHETADYLIVLRENPMNKLNNYKFVTAYPVVHNGTKRRLDRSYKKFIKK